MSQVLVRALALFRRPAVLLTGLLLMVGGSALIWVPLFSVPGYELGTALALGAGIFGGVTGAAAAFQERRLIQGRDPRPHRAERKDNPLLAAYLAIAAATLLNVFFVLVPLTVAVVHALSATPCDPFAHLGFVPLLALPSAAIAAATGVFVGFWAEGGLTATLAYVAFLLVSAAASAWPLIQGPQAFAFNHYGGYLPGPIYDEALSIRPSLLWYRLLTLLFAALLWLVTAITLNMKEGRVTRPHIRPGVLALLGLLLASIVTLEDRGPSLGFRMNADFLRESDHFVFVYPREKSPEDLERLVRDAEFRYAQITQFLGHAPGGKLRVFIYRSAEEKQALVGASHTEFAKPWLLEAHLNDGAFPLGTLKHELVHVMAAPFGTGPFRVTTRWNIWPLVGIIEGLATAGDNPVDELTLHEWAAGMRRQSLAPDVRRLLGPQGFYEASGGRAYTVVGSFLRYLADTYGAQKLTALYARGDFEKAYGRNLEGLATEWEKFLDALPLDTAAVNQAFARFRGGSLFTRTCAREVASDQVVAGELLGSNPEAALALYERCAKLQPDDPSFALGQAAALSRLDRKDQAAGVLGLLAERVKDQSEIAAQVGLSQADLAVQLGKPQDARTALAQAIALKPSAAVERTARVKLAALDSPAGPAVWAYFKPGHEDAKLLLLKEALDHEPQNAIVSYLIGRRMSGVAPRIALSYLGQALQRELPDSLRREALRLQIENFYLAGDCAGVRYAAGALPDFGAAFKGRALEWVERCDFEETTFKRPLVPEGPFH